RVKPGSHRAHPLHPDVPGQQGIESPVQPRHVLRPAPVGQKPDALAERVHARVGASCAGRGSAATHEALQYGLEFRLHGAPVPLQPGIAALADRRSLSEPQTTEAFGVVMRGEATPAQIAALLMGLRVKGETPEEVAGAARALREAMVRVEANGAHLVDTCG